MGLEKFLNARSVAIIGASLDERKRGYQAIQALRRSGFEGRIYPVHPKEECIQGLTCYRDVLEIPETVDIALITTPAATVPGLLDSGKKDSGVVVVAGGSAAGEKAGRRRSSWSKSRGATAYGGANTSA